MRLLLIEDSETLRRSLTIGLSKLGYSVDATGNGADGLSMALVGHYDLLILDLMLPDLDGLAILAALRKRNVDVRVLILSARSEPEERTEGILAGADDYLGKPFSFDELTARLMNLMRRGTSNSPDDCIRVNDFCLNLQNKTFCFRDQLIELTPNEYKIIECLFSHRNKIVTSEKLSEFIAGSYDMISKNSIEANLSAIRKKARDLDAELPVRNRRGFGYIVEHP